MSNHREHVFATGIELGDELSPQTLFWGTVMVSLHPEFDNLKDELKKEGYELLQSEGNDAYVQISVKRGDQPGRTKVIKNICINPSMRWLDLEHELIHVSQMEKIISQGLLAINTIRGEKQKSSLMFKSWQAVAIEFHARLVEFIQLDLRNVPQNILFDHAQGLMFWHKKYKKSGIIYSPSKKEWVSNYLDPEIKDKAVMAGRIISARFPILNR